MDYSIGFTALPNSDAEIQGLASHLNQLLAQAPLTTFAVVSSTVQFILAAAHTNPTPSFIAEGFQYLQIGTITPNHTLGMDLTAAGAAHFQADITKRKQESLDLYLQHIQTNNAAITAIYGQQAAALDAFINNRPAQVQQAIDGILGIQPPLLADMDALRAMRTARDDRIQSGASGKLASVLNEVGIPQPLREKLAACLLDAMVKNCTKSREARAQITNRTRLDDIARTFDPQANLGKVMPGSDAFIRHVADIEAAFVHHIQAGDVQASQVGGSLLTTRSGNVLQPALQQFAAYVKAQIGTADLEVAAQLTFDQAMVTYGLLSELLATARQLLERIRLQVADSSNGAVIFTGLGLYVPDDIDEYLTAMNRFQAPLQRNDANHFCSTYFNSLDVPLIQTTAGGFSFYNSDEGLFAVDLATPPVLQTPSGNLDLSTGVHTQMGSLDNDAIKRLLAPSRGFSFNKRRSYLPLYVFGGQPMQMLPHILWQKSTGGGHGIGRADGIYDNDYLWSIDPGWLTVLTHNDPAQNDAVIAAIGRFLGLDLQQFVPKDPQYWLEAQDAGYRYVFYRRELGNNQDDEYYVLCNMPKLGSRVPLYYFRKIAFGQNNLLSRKVIKDIEQSGNRPYPHDVNPVFQDGVREFGISLPLAFSLDGNRQQFNSDKHQFSVIKNRGNPLTTNPRLRKNAGAVMSTIRPYCPVPLNAGNAYLGSSELVQTVVVPKAPPASATALAFFQQARRTEAKQVVTDQEWCHLRGHGDGGEERVGNFVAGSNHCNTEQLAIESAQRQSTHAGQADYRLFTTAYLLPDASMNTVGDRSYLLVDAKYLQRAYADKPASDLTVQHDLNRTAANAPIAAFIRYRIYRHDGQQRHKLFEHLFEGQNEFFDKNQYNILQFAVRWSLDEAGVTAELQAFVEEIQQQAGQV